MTKDDAAALMCDAIGTVAEWLEANPTAQVPVRLSAILWALIAANKELDAASEGDG